MGYLAPLLKVLFESMFDGGNKEDSKESKGSKAFESKDFKANVRVISLGGDFVEPGATEGQKLHGDGYTVRPEPNSWCQWIVASFAVHNISYDDAPLMFVPRRAMFEWYEDAPPTEAAQVAELLRRLEDPFVCMLQGEVFLRDPRVWHAGTPNRSTKTCYLPGCIYECFDEPVLPKGPTGRPACSFFPEL